jgi:hypothetical protein
VFQYQLQQSSPVVVNKATGEQVFRVLLKSGGKAEQQITPQANHVFPSCQLLRFSTTSEQSARRVSSTTINYLRSRSTSSFIHQYLVNWHALGRAKRL